MNAVDVGDVGGGNEDNDCCDLDDSGDLSDSRIDNYKGVDDEVIELNVVDDDDRNFVDTIDDVNVNDSVCEQ